MADNTAMLRQLLGQDAIFEREIAKIKQLAQVHERRLRVLEARLAEPVSDGPAEETLAVASAEADPDIPRDEEGKPYEVRHVFGGFAVFQGMKMLGEKGSRASAEALKASLEAGQ